LERRGHAKDDVHNRRVWHYSFAEQEGDRVRRVKTRRMDEAIFVLSIHFSDARPVEIFKPGKFRIRENFGHVEAQTGNKQRFLTATQAWNPLLRRAQPAWAHLAARIRPRILA
jgi:hypothetical protein